MKNYSRNAATAQRNIATSFVAPWRRCGSNLLSTSLIAAIVSLLLLSSTGCIVAGGYSSGRGFFIWPGTIVLLVIGLVLWMLFRRRG